MFIGVANVKYKTYCIPVVVRPYIVIMATAAVDDTIEIDKHGQNSQIRIFISLERKAKYI